MKRGGESSERYIHTHPGCKCSLVEVGSTQAKQSTSDRMSYKSKYPIIIWIQYSTMSWFSHHQSEMTELQEPTGSPGGGVVGVTEEALAFATNISNHPETWLDFPLAEYEDDDDFEMSDTQWNHVTLVERLAPRLAALRIELCSIHMTESYFWKVYFVLLHPRLNKHDADLLSTPQIVAARSMWMKELQKQTNPGHELSEINTSRRSNSMHDDFAAANRSAHTFEPTTHTMKHIYPLKFEESDKQEVGLTRTSLDHRTSSSYTIPVEYDDNVDDDDYDWIHENSELNGYVGTDIHIGTEEDISFSDLEADDDCTMRIRSKIM